MRHSCAFLLGRLATLNSSLCVRGVAAHLLPGDDSKEGHQVCHVAIICHDLELQKHNACLSPTTHQRSQARRFETFSSTTNLGIHHCFQSSSVPGLTLPVCPLLALQILNKRPQWHINPLFPRPFRSDEFLPNYERNMSDLHYGMIFDNLFTLKALLPHLQIEGNT